MPDENNLRDLRSICIAITDAVKPDETFLVEENFESFCEESNSAAAQKEGRFIPREALVSFGAAVVAFLLTVFQDAVKDVLKKRVAERLKRFYAKNETATSEDKKQLKEDILQLLEQSKLIPEEKARLREGFSRLLETQTTG